MRDPSLVKAFMRQAISQTGEDLSASPPMEQSVLINPFQDEGIPR